MTDEQLTKLRKILDDLRAMAICLRKEAVQCFNFPLSQKEMHYKALTIECGIECLEEVLPIEQAPEDEGKSDFEEHNVWNKAQTGVI